jgi:hypothetical protein
MRFRTALLTAGVLIAALFGFQPLMSKLVERSMAQGVFPGKIENSLFMASLLCRELWWLLVPAILGFFLLIAIVTAVVRHYRKKPGTTTATASTGN